MSQGTTQCYGVTYWERMGMKVGEGTGPGHLGFAFDCSYSGSELEENWFLRVTIAYLYFMMPIMH